MDADSIRTYHPADRVATMSLFERAGRRSPTAALWGHSASEADVYLFPYSEEEVGRLLLAQREGQIVGYLAGCVDGRRFSSEEERITDAVRRHRLMLRPRPAAFFARAAYDVAWSRVRGEPTAGDLRDPRWPAHLHINVLPEYRGRGVAAALMQAWFDQLKATGSRGCHLQTLLENDRATAFFTKMGFSPHGRAVLVPGTRWHGHRTHQLTMVRRLDN